MLSGLYNNLKRRIQIVDQRLILSVQAKNEAKISGLFSLTPVIFSFWLNLELLALEILTDFVKFLIMIFSDAGYSFELFYNQRNLQSCPYSYSGYRKTQSRIRLFSTASLVAIVSVAIITSLTTNLIFGGKRPSLAASFGWAQESWLGDVSINQADHSNNRKLWDHFSSSSLIKILTNGTLTLATTTLATSTFDFSTSGLDNSFMNNGFPTIKKLDNAKCATTTECSSGACSEDFDNISLKYCHSNSSKCIDWMGKLSGVEYSNTDLHCSGNAYYKTCDTSGLWGATTTTPFTDVDCSAQGDPAKGGYRLASESTCADNVGFTQAPTCHACTGGYIANAPKNGCLATCSTRLDCINSSVCYNSGCIPDPCGGATSISYNGDTYQIVTIGNRCWFAENLRTTLKPDGVTPITRACGTPGCGSPWGGLYGDATTINGGAFTFAAGQQIQGICPNGWHIPSDNGATDDFEMLAAAVGNNFASLYATGTVYWNAPNAGATNASGFNAIGAGHIIFGGSYSGYKTDLVLWTTTATAGYDPKMRFFDLTYKFERGGYGGADPKSYIRCVKNY